VAALQRLPGVGPYTARAVAGIAFGRPVGAVDTNVRRVLGRLGGATAGEVQALADAVVPHARPADWTHALMDLGAIVCRAREPRCDACPVQAWCAWDGDTAVMPTRRIEPAFPATRRWLRGRILDRLRDAAGDGGWTALDGPVGGHDANAVAEAVTGLARDGLLERDPRHPLRCRLPLA
jgi:A/G-specific adenine glycosylase